MQEILYLAILGMNARDNSLEIGEAFRERRELFFKRRVIHQVFHGVQPGVVSQGALIVAQENSTLS